MLQCIIKKIIFYSKIQKKREAKFKIIYNVYVKKKTNKSY